MAKKQYHKALFIFRRDLRLHDNTALNEALKTSTEVIPCFIFDPRQLEQNPYRSDNALQFMLQSLDDLEQQLNEHASKLYRLYGKAEEIIGSLIKDHHIDAVYLNSDYTPFSKKRDEAITAICIKHEVAFHSLDDALLHPPTAITKKDGKPYTVFTPYFKQASKHPVQLPMTLFANNFFTKHLGTTVTKNISWQASPEYFLAGGRSAGLGLTIRLEQQRAYAKTRDIPALDTTHLSPHLKFGTLSAREVHHALVKHYGSGHPLIRQLYWRDFYTCIAWWFPHVFGKPFKQQYATIPWSHDKAAFERWCTGTTGFPIVDAGMRELNQTGFMHNRVRMITASFLIKDLGIDWQWGERYFATKLIDYDPAVNNGNWQWVASTGCDPQPYFRIFNPWMQQKKFDPQCIYIKHWIKELETSTLSQIHSPKRISSAGYPAPMLDHQKASHHIKSWYKKGTV